MITFNNTKTILDLVKNVKKEYENRVFIRYERDESIYEKGYGTFSTDTQAVASYIDSQNEKLGHRVHAAILGKCSYEFLTVLLGVPCAGGISIPLDVQLSLDSLVENLTKADVDILFYDRDYAGQVELVRERCPFIKRYVCLQSQKNVRCVPMMHRVYRGENIRTKIKADECAMIIFTSGTTGHGKGVMLSHSNIIDNMFCTDEETEVCLNVLPIHHIFCISGDLMLVLRYGSTLCLCDDLTKILYYIQLFQPTMMRLVPMMAKMLCNRVSILQKKYPDMQVSELRNQVFGKRMYRMTSGGGYLSEDLAVQLDSLGIKTGQGYGMSECSPKISVPDLERKEKMASVGRLVTGCQVRIVDNEIQVKSPSVMMGYYNDPELTAEAITEDGWLCTGDLGYVDEDNFLYLNGRKKNLIILSNGENVSPEMIENKFDGENLISDILVYGSGELIATEIYPNFEFAQVQGVKDVEAAVREIVAAQNANLPTYAQIAEVSVRTVPFEKTSSKKIIRQKFFEAKNKKETVNKETRKPETELQQRIYDLVARQIGNTDFGIDENMYQSGLDSMGSMMLIADFTEEMELNITLAELMDHSTVISLESLIMEKEEQKKAVVVSSAPREVYPLTSLQKYFAYIIPGNTTGNLPFALQLDKNIDLAKLREAIWAVMDAHPSLKAIVKPTEQKYYAIFRDDTRVIDIPIVQIADEEVNAKMQELVVPFTYRAEDNLVHACLFEGQKYNYMFLDVAHFMGDGMTMKTLMEDLNKAYVGEAIEKESYTTYDYILEESQREQNGIRAKDIAYVDELLSGIKMRSSLLNKTQYEDMSQGRYGSIRKRFESVTRKKVLYYGKNHGVSENALFVAAFNYCISLFAGEQDVFCSSIHSGRTDSRWNRIAGPLFETYYCRYTVVPHESVEDLIKKTGRQIMNTMKCLTSCPREGEMFFQFQGDILNVPQIGEKETERLPLQLDSLPFHFQIMYDDYGYYTELRFWENRFDAETLQVFLTCFEEVLKAMLEEASVDQLKYHLPDEVYPKRFYVEAGKLEAAAGREFLKCVDKEELVKVYIYDENYRKKPFGAWGNLYVMNYETENYTDVVQYPYGPGMLYNSGMMARILPDVTIDFKENAGRVVVSEGIRGRNYYDLKKAEELLMAFEGVTDAQCYMAFDKELNEMSLFAQLQYSGTLSAEEMQEQLKANGESLLIPKFIIMNS